MADPAVAALNSLLREASIDDHAEALELATAAVRSDKIQGPDLASAQHTRVVALLKLDRYDDALRVIAEGGDALEKDCSFEKAYALYKTGDLEGAEAVLQKTGVDTGKSQRGLKHVAGQVAYRNEKFERAAAIYRDLKDDTEGANYGEENDLRINLTAADAQLQWQGKEWAVPEEEKQPAREDLEAFETAYNAACICISMGDYTKASVLLKRSRDLCEATEDLNEEEKKAELVPILMQQAFVFTKLGKLDEALSLQNAINLSEVSETSTKVIAQGNKLLPKATANPFIAERLARALPKIEGNDRLFGFQTAALQRNKNVIDLQAQKFEGKEIRAHKLLAGAQVPDLSVSKVDLGVAGAAAATKCGDGKPTVRQLLPLLEKRPNDIGLLLTIIQLYIQISTLPPAILLLEKFFTRLEEANTPEHVDVRFAPGLVALAVSLYRSQNRQRDVRNELAKAAVHWRSKTEAAGAGSSIAREAGIELLRSSHPSDLAAAGEAFEQILSAQPGDRTATAGLVASYATTDFAKVEPYLESLPSVEKLTQGVDVSALIDAGVALLTPPSSQQSKKRKFDGEGAAPEKEKQQPAKKPRKRKLPKNYDPTKKPDPERWLPLRDRSTYRPKGKKGKKRAQEATQGGVVKEEETLELAGGAGSVKVEKAGGGGGGANKKKKKGKK
ncbi:Signal recognition particle subunit SRP72 [Podospora pseudoanserina]|uniref:Signal recognition particle subunit SRP72 n=1 Tax=Podospora pseudoanserina TaxID=2609844 RepID=A0ABR0IGP4_9PEZI|nr:Signal recognition particle subunit SRP72 [Podospora pseudoanserina]